MVKLSTVATISAGQSAPKNNYFSENGIPFIRAGSLEFLINGKGLDYCEKINETNAKICKLKLYPKNAVLFAKSGMSANKGRVYKLERDSYVVSHLAVVVTDSCKLLPSYFMYWLKINSPRTLIKDESYPSISLSDIGNLDIDCPSIEEQQRIVNILDKAEEIRTKKKLANEKLDEFLKSTFIDMFGDPVTNPKDFPTQKLNDIATLKNGINFLKGDSGFEVKCLGVSNFKDNNFIVDSTNFNVVEVSNKPSEDYYLKKNDIVFVRSNGSKELVGRTVLIKTEGKIVFSGFCIRCRLTSNMNPIYLLMLLKTESMKNAFSHDGHGCNIKSLNQQMLGNLDIIISPLELQNQFAQIVHKVEAQKEKNQKVIEQMDNLFNSLMQQAFKGKI